MLIALVKASNSSNEIRSVNLVRSSLSEHLFSGHVAQLTGDSV